MNRIVQTEVCSVFLYFCTSVLSIFCSLFIHEAMSKVHQEPLSPGALPIAAGAKEDEEGEEQECCHGCQTSPQDDVDLSSA